MSRQTFLGVKGLAENMVVLTRRDTWSVVRDVTDTGDGYRRVEFWDGHSEDHESDGLVPVGGPDPRDREYQADVAAYDRGEAQR